MNQNAAPASAGEERKFYYLIAGEMTFYVGDEPTDVASVKGNAIVISSDGRFAVPQIGMAQQALQHSFHKRKDSDIDVHIVDVVILAIIPLGLFTSAEFNKQAEGVEAIPVTDIPTDRLMSNH